MLVLVPLIILLLVRLAGDEQGRLHMAIECHSCFQWLMPTIDRFRDHWQEVEVDIPSGHNFDPLPALAREQLDLVITADPQPLPGVHYEPLFRYEGLLAVAKQHRLAGKAFVRPDDLAEETLITYPVEHERLDVFTQFLDPAGVVPHEVRTAELTIMMMQLVASGRGVCALPNWALTEYLERDYVRALPLGENGVWSTLFAAIREEQRESDRALTKALYQQRRELEVQLKRLEAALDYQARFPINPALDLVMREIEMIAKGM